MTDPREQKRWDARVIEDDVVTVRGFIDYPTASGRDVYLRAVEALDRLASLAHRGERRDDLAAYAIRSAEARLASVPALVEALRGMIELNGYRERQLLVNAEWAFAIVSDAQAALAVYEQSQGNG